MSNDLPRTGFMGAQGEATPAHFGVDVDILTGTLAGAFWRAIGAIIARAAR